MDDKVSRRAIARLPISQFVRSFFSRCLLIFAGHVVSRYQLVGGLATPMRVPSLPIVTAQVFPPASPNL